MARVRRAVGSDVAVLLPLIDAYWEFESITGFDANQIAGPLERLLSEAHLGAGWIALADDVAVGYLLAVAELEFVRTGCTNVSLQLSRNIEVPFSRPATTRWTAAAGPSRA